MFSPYRLLILDADGTTIDAFTAIERAFAHHGMDIGDLSRFQRRHNLFKYLGGLKEFPVNLGRQIGRRRRARLLDTLTEVYRDEARLYPGVSELIRRLIEQPGLRVGLITRNIAHEPQVTLAKLFRRHAIDLDALDFFIHVPLKETKLDYFRAIRNSLAINPARAYACGDEYQDYAIALATGMHPFMVAYGFEGYERLRHKFGVPAEVISRHPEEFRARVEHALDIT
jgi:phosphoglycolate phosphatase